MSMFLAEKNSRKYNLRLGNAIIILFMAKSLTFKMHNHQSLFSITLVVVHFHDIFHISFTVDNNSLCHPSREISLLLYQQNKYYLKTLLFTSAT